MTRCGFWYGSGSKLGTQGEDHYHWRATGLEGSTHKRTGLERATGLEGSTHERTGLERAGEGGVGASVSLPRSGEGGVGASVSLPRSYLILPHLTPCRHGGAIGWACGGR